MGLIDREARNQYARELHRRKRSKILAARWASEALKPHVQMPLFERHCPNCGELKPLEAFFPRKRDRQCKCCIALRSKRWRENNPDYVNPRASQILAKYRAKHREKILERNRIADRKRRAQKRVWERQYRQTNISFRIANNLRRRIRGVLSGQYKSARLSELLGCSVKDFMIYLESKFKPGMAWENYGTIWSVDHIMPCALFDLSKTEQQQICFHFSNQQPMFAIENSRKGIKVYGMADH